MVAERSIAEAQGRSLFFLGSADLVEWLLKHFQPLITVLTDRLLLDTVWSGASGPEIGHSSTTGRGGGVFGGLEPLHRYNLHFTEGFLRPSRYKSRNRAVTRPLQNERPVLGLFLARRHAPDHRLPEIAHGAAHMTKTVSGFEI